MSSPRLALTDSFRLFAVPGLVCDDCSRQLLPAREHEGRDLMRHRNPEKGTGTRRGAAVAEMAILLSVLSFLFIITIDFARLFYYSLTLKNCARNGAYFASDYPGIYGYGSASAAALADTPNLSPDPTI